MEQKNALKGLSGLRESVFWGLPCTVALDYFSCPASGAQPTILMTLTTSLSLVDKDARLSEYYSWSGSPVHKNKPCNLRMPALWGKTSPHLSVTTLLSASLGTLIFHHNTLIQIRIWLKQEYMIMAKPTGSSENKSQKQVWFTDTFHELNTPRDFKAACKTNTGSVNWLKVATLPS